MPEPNRRWGHMEEGFFVPLPKLPLINAGLGPPPFVVELHGGRKRLVVEEPVQAEPALETEGQTH